MVVGKDRCKLTDPKYANFLTRFSLTRANGRNVHIDWKNRYVHARIRISESFLTNRYCEEWLIEHAVKGIYIPFTYSIHTQITYIKINNTYCCGTLHGRLRLALDRFFSRHTIWNLIYFLIRRLWLF